MIWKNSIWTSFEDGNIHTNLNCEVRIDGEDIVVSYDVGVGRMMWTGKEVGPGHFKLTLSSSADGRNGRATLHRAPDSDMLEGHWIELGEEGMWRIQLEE